MKMSAAFIATLRDPPRDAETVSHQLMMRSGMLRKHAAGLYSYLPMMVKSYHKLCQIMREEFEKISWQEVIMPFVVPAELWQESGRWTAYGPEMARFKDRKQNDFCLGPTHEEVVTDLVRGQVSSYKQLPVTLFQITDKFRDEVRPRFGIMRAREFIMMDGYSFHTDRADLDRHYEEIAGAYERIFKRAGLKFCRVDADTGAIGGSGSHEFHVLAQSGEDAILSCSACGYAANVEKAETPAPAKQKKDWGAQASTAFEKFSTPTQKTIEDVSKLTGIPAHRSVKTIVFKYNTTTDIKVWKPVVAFISGDRQLNEVKLKTALRLGGVKDVLDVASYQESDVAKLFNSEVGFLGPIGAPQGVPTFFDLEIAAQHSAVCGANEAGFHFKNVEPVRDFKAMTSSNTFDLVNAIKGDSCPKCTGTMSEDRGIEVGHIFKLGTKYSSAMKAEFHDDAKQSKVIEMGCYGIGVTRVIAAAIEQNHDADGIIWPEQLAPYDVHLLNLGTTDAAVTEIANQMYKMLQSSGFSVLYDDRDLAPGAKFKDSDLIGIPKRLVIGAKGLQNKEIEFVLRRGREKKMLSFDVSKGDEAYKSVLAAL